MLGPGRGAQAHLHRHANLSKGGMYLRSDLGWVHASNYASGYVFARRERLGPIPGVLEFGFIFGTTFLPNIESAFASSFHPYRSNLASS